MTGSAHPAQRMGDLLRARAEAELEGRVSAERLASWIGLNQPSRIPICRSLLRPRRFGRYAYGAPSENVAQLMAERLRLPWADVYLLYASLQLPYWARRADGQLAAHGRRGELERACMGCSDPHLGRQILAQVRGESPMDLGPFTQLMERLPQRDPRSAEIQGLESLI